MENGELQGPNGENESADSPGEEATETNDSGGFSIARQRDPSDGNAELISLADGSGEKHAPLLPALSATVETEASEGRHGVHECRRLLIISMQERARLAARTLDVRSSPGHGTTVTATIPLVHHA